MYVHPALSALSSAPVVHSIPGVAAMQLPAAPRPKQSPQVAYFCAEFGLQAGLPFYAGGLGILAGDVVKQAANEHFPMIGVGLFYHGKRDRQSIDPDGWQHYRDYHFDPADHGFYEVCLPDGTPWRYDLPLGHESVAVFALALPLSDNTVVYFLETDRPENPQHLRDLVLAPYWGDDRMQLQQQLVLGCAGVRLLKDLGLVPPLFHLNEGRPAFLTWELANQLQVSESIPGDEALDQVRERMVYTNHTLVRAGNVSYTRALVHEFALPYAERLGVPVETLLDLGTDSDPERFEITEYALRMSRRASGVSTRHTDLCTREWPEFEWVNVTNGVHMPTWQRPELTTMAALSDTQVWTAHQQAKELLVKEAIHRTSYGYNPQSLVLGWARRITDYKRLDSLFADLQRFQQVFRDSERPVQLLIAGKAHPGDDHAKHMLQSVIRLFQTELSGIALFIPNYDIGLAQRLVAGVDVWLNTPVDGREASGTSGMKAAANGVLQASVADGWAAEVDWSDTGWTLEPAQPGQHLLDLLQSEIKPLFYERDAKGIPTGWVERMRRSQAVSEHYSAERMLREYREKLYAGE